MNACARGYGSVELRFFAHRYWMWGFAISFTIHCAVLALFQVPGIKGITAPVIKDLHSPWSVHNPTIDWTNPGGSGLPKMPAKQPNGFLRRR